MIQTTFNPEGITPSIHKMKKKKSRFNHETGEYMETIQEKDALKNIKGHYKIELFDKDGNPTETIEADNATPYIYSMLGTHRSLHDLGVGTKNDTAYDQFRFETIFDKGHLFLTNEENKQEESVRGAIPTSRATGIAVLDQAYTGDNVAAGTVNVSQKTVVKGINSTTMTYIFDFALERGNGTFDTVWLQHSTGNRYENDYKLMTYTNNGHWKTIDYLSLKNEDMGHGIAFTQIEDFPEFYPLDGFTYWGQTYMKHHSQTLPHGFYVYAIDAESDEYTLQPVVIENSQFNDVIEGGAGVWNGKPSVLKRKATATNIYEVLVYDLVSDVGGYRVTNQQVKQLRTESIPNHADLRLIQVKTFDDVIYAIFKPVDPDKAAVAYCVKYDASTLNYINHTTFNFNSDYYNHKHDEYRLKSNVDVYRINDLDYLIVHDQDQFKMNYGLTYSIHLTNENKVVDISHCNAFPTLSRGQGLPRQVYPNGLTFIDSDNASLGTNRVRLLALLAPFSHTKINTVNKDSSQSMRITYTIKVYHHILDQFLTPDSSLEENLLLSEDQEENISLFSKFKSVFSTK